MYAAFSVRRPPHNNQPLVESVPRRERPGEGRLFGLHGQISLNFDRGKWPCGGLKLYAAPQPGGIQPPDRLAVAKEV